MSELHVNVYWFSCEGIPAYVTGVPHSPDMCHGSCRNAVPCDADGQPLRSPSPPAAHLIEDRTPPPSRTRPRGMAQP